MGFYPHPPVNKRVSWKDMDIPVVVNDFSWLPGPCDHRGPAKPEEEGKEIINYTVRVQAIPMCMGNGTHCLNITFQIWLSIVNHNTNQDFHNTLCMLYASGFRGQETDATSSINLPFCETWVTNKESYGVHWQQCKGEKPRVLINSSHGDIIDWSLYSAPQGKYSHSELRWHWDSLHKLWKLAPLLLNLSNGMETGCQPLCYSLIIQFRLICGHWQVPYTLLKCGKES